MITLEQVRLLEEKVESAVLKIAALTAENADLRRTLTEISTQNSDFAKKNANLIDMLSKNEENQDRIEKGILNALYRLNDIESAVLNPNNGSEQTSHNQNVAEQNANTTNFATESSIQTPENYTTTPSFEEIKIQSTESNSQNTIDDIDHVEMQVDFESDETTESEEDTNETKHNSFGQQNTVPEGQIDIF